MRRTNYHIATNKLIEAARILLDDQEGKPSLHAIWIATEINALALEVLASGTKEQG
ncbi:MAG: hypothetical protein IKG22_15420 [Atopobiaceae bacterium]|nr:hypothetical protein [Atopobiaceae bacterium]